MAEVLRCEGLRKSFGQHEVLKGIDLVVSRGETVVIVGASGSGKSTLLRCVNFLEYPTAGRIHLAGELIGKPSGRDGEIQYRESDLCHLRARVGMVFQHFNLFPHLTVEQNVMIALLKIRGMDRDKARKLAFSNLDRLGMASFATQYPSRLSGGQQQRVAIARALAMEPLLMLFDEATSALDPELVGEVLLAMRQLSQDGTTMLVVTHELGFAYNVAHRVVFLHDGRVHEEGTPQQVLLNPRQQRTREFISGFTLFRMPENATAQSD